MLVEILLVVLGLVGLWLGTELVIRGSLEISNHFKLSHVFVGLTVLAVGTNLPELMVTIMSSVEKLQGIDTSGIIIGNIIGSCFSQVFLTLGVVGFLAYFTLTKKEIFREGSVLLGSIVLLFLLGFDGKLTKFEGFVFMIVYILYFLAIQREERKKSREMKRAPKIHVLWTIVSLVAGLGIVLYSSKIVVDNGVALANLWQIEKSLIGILLIGLGSSLPELVLSLGAALKGNPGLSLGNLVGANIFDLLFVLGLGASISGVDISRNLLFFDIPFLFFASVLFLIFFLWKKGLQKKEAGVLLAIYLVYVILKFVGF